MPTYEYECPSCGHRFEVFQRITEAPKRSCPSCKGRRVRRVLSGGAGLLFKGSGFYITDYRSDSYRRAAKADTTAHAPATDKKTGGSKSSGGK